MSSSFPQLALVTIILLLAHALAAIPWLLALDRRNWQRLRSPQVWGIGLALVAGIGLALALYLDSASDPKVLSRWGRVLTSLLHLQLAADFFVLCFWLMLKYWSKGGAVALASFQEGLRQPMFWLLFGVAAFLMAASPFFPYFTFGEDLKMVKELCYAFTMLAAAAFAVIAASISVSEEIEGRTAVTLMSKPISRRQFLLGKFGGMLLSAMVMTIMLGFWLVWVVLFKESFDPPINPAEATPEPAWVAAAVNDIFPDSAAGDLLKGAGFWIHEAGVTVPGLVIGFCQVMVLLAIAVALSTRLPMIVTLTVCLVVYFLGHLTPIMNEVTRGGYRLVHFVAQLFDTVLPGLDLFDVGSAIIRDVPLPAGGYAIYTLNVALYAITYTTIALLFGLILFEDRDLA